MKKILRKAGILFAAAVLLVIVPFTARANDAIGRITLVECDLNTGKPVSGISLAIYQVAVADNSADGIAYTSDFTGLKSDAYQLQEGKLINGNNQTESVQKLDLYLKEHHDIQPMQVAATDKNGEITFQNLPDGVYYFQQIRQNDETQANNTQITAYPFFISLPISVGGVVTRTIMDAKPKCLVKHTLKNIDITVYKVWKDNNNKAGKRPESIQVELLDGKVCIDRQVLNDVNNWTYCWSGLGAEGHNWSVNEVSVPDNYTSEITQEGNNYTITNTLIKIPTPNTQDRTSSSTYQSPSKTSNHMSAVKTGDISNIRLWVSVMAVSASVAALIIRKRKSRGDFFDG